MKALTKYSLESLKKNKKRTIMTILGVALSAAMIFAITGIFATFHYSIINSALDNYGDFHVMYEAVPGDLLKIIESDENIASYYYSEIVPADAYSNEDSWYADSIFPIPAQYYKIIHEATNRTANHAYNIFVKFKNLDADVVNKTESRIYGQLADTPYIDNLHIRENSSYMLLSGNMSELSRLLISIMAVFIYWVLIIISIFIIRNSFEISTTERAQQFGILMSIGARPRQIRKLVYIEALVIGTIAAPFGILLGALADFLLVQACNVLIGSMAEYDLHVVIPLIVPILIIAINYLIVWMSSASAAIVASRKSPISAIRSSDDIKVKNKQLKTSHLAKKLFGIGGVIASKNLKRSRRKYRTTVVSIAVSVSVFVGFATIIHYGYDLINMVFPNYDASYEIYNATPAELTKILQNTRYEEAAYYTLNFAQEIKPDDYYGADTRYLITITSRDYFAKYAKSIGAEASDYTHTVILEDKVRMGELYKRKTDLAVGDTQTLRVTNAHENENGDPVFIDDDVSFTISAITDRRPFGVQYDDILIIVSEDYFEKSKLVSDNDNFNSTFFYANPGTHADEITDYAENLARENDSDIRIVDTELQKRYIKNIITLAAIFIYSFIGVLALIGITNIFNTITTNIELRAKEFAMLKSVGMTDAEFNRMIRLESFMYSTRALFIGLPIGILISYGIYRVIVSSGINFNYAFPLVPILISVASVALLIWATMAYSVKQISKQNIIDTIRSDSI